MKKIAFDVMGNDNGIVPCINAVLNFLKINNDYFFYLVGKKQEILKHIKENKFIKIIDAKEIKDKNISPRTLKNSNFSMTMAIKLVKEKKADIVISSGDSGLYLSLTTLILNRINGVKRSAFMPIFPTIQKNKKFIMMDVGANILTTKEMIVQWAKIGNIFSKKFLNILNPKIGVLNIGIEDKKGHEFQIEANKILKKTKNINYVGFIEPRELLDGIVDVSIVDGYGGNLILKTMEGTMTSIFKILKNELKSKLIYKIGAFLSKGAYKNIKDIISYKNVGAAWIIGLNQLALKAHGSSDEESFIGAFNQAKIALNSSVIKDIKKVFQNEN